MYPLSFLNYHQLAQIQETVACGQGVKQALPAEALSRDSHRSITLQRAQSVSHLQTHMQNRAAIKHLEREDTKAEGCSFEHPSLFLTVQSTALSVVENSKMRPVNS